VFVIYLYKFSAGKTMEKMMMMMMMMIMKENKATSE
jgi:hypothetical protein